MLTIKRAISTLGLSLFVFAAIAGTAAAQELIPITGITVTAARPGKSDVARLRKILELGAATDQEIEERHAVYIVKVFARFQPGPAEVVLSIGSTPLPQYGAFAGGLFVRVYDPAKLRSFGGQPVKLIRKGPRGEEPSLDTTTLLRFPTQAADAPHDKVRKTVDEVLKGG